MEQSNTTRITGLIQINKYGDGFIPNPDPNEKDIFIPRQELNGALDGDIVSVELVSDFHLYQKKIRIADKFKERTIGSVNGILRRNVSNVVGVIKKGPDGLYFESEDKRKLTIKLDSSEFDKVVEGNKVVVECNVDLGDGKYLGTIKNILGHKDDPRMDIISLYASKGIIDQFPQEVIDELETIPTEVSEKDMEGRMDLRNRMIFTIDGDDTKDIDDAISLDRDSEGNYILGVHIADVTNYVKEGSALDKEALRRGTSCYPPGAVIPMLPHKLSNGICSLNEDVDRLAMSCFIKIKPDGKVASTRVVKSVIRSNKKMTYKNVNSILENDVVPEGYEKYAKTLKNMQELSLILRGVRLGKGAMNFESNEVKFKFDENGKPIDIIDMERGEAEKLIEDFMIAANEATARMIYDSKKKTGIELPGIYRTHAKPSPMKVQAFVEKLEAMGHPIKGDYTVTNFDTLSKIINQITFKNEYEKDAIEQMAVRTVPKAEYSTTNIGHAGLASTCYTHFTSPIRRYPDLEHHRLIKKFIIEKRRDAKTIDFYESIVGDICYQTTSCEQAADAAEYEAIDMKMAEFMADYINEEFDAHIINFEYGSIYVKLDNNITGIISSSDISKQYRIIADEFCIENKSTKEKLTIGSPLRVRCISAEPESGKVRFEFADVPELTMKEEPKKLSRKKNGRNK